MKVDVRALGTFNRLARQGAEHAADSLGELTAVRPSVETTSLDLIEREDIGEGLPEFVGVEIGLSGGIAGAAVLAIEREGAAALLDSLPGGDGGSVAGRRGRIEEVGNILTSGFIDGWADYLGTTVDLTPPEFVSGEGADVVPSDAPTWDDYEHVFAVTNELEAATEAASAHIYLFPDADSFERIVAAEEREESVPIPIEELATFNRMTREGARRTSENLTAMTGIETAVAVSRISFVPIERAPRTLEGQEYAGVVLEFEGLPSGYLLILFDTASAKRVVDALVPDGDGLDGMGKSAIGEIGNVMTSGFIDGWANVLGTSIEHTPPQFVHDLGGAIMDPVAAELAQRQEFAFIIDSTIETAEGEIECELYALPDERELSRALSELDVEGGDGEDPFPGMEASYEDL